MKKIRNETMRTANYDVCFTEDLYSEHKQTFQNYMIEIRKYKNRYLIISIILISDSLLLFLFNIQFNYVELLIFNVIVISIFFTKWNDYYNARKIEKYLITKNLMNKVGNIYFKNPDSCFLMENYIILLDKGNILCFNYSKIKKVYKEYGNKFPTGAGYNYIELRLHLILENGRECSMLIEKSSNYWLLNKGNCQNIINYLLKKNATIEIQDDVVTNKICMK